MAARTVAGLLILWAVSLEGGPVSSPGRQDVGPPVPYEDVGACPFEGCVYREWTANDNAVVRTDRTLDADVLYTVKKGERVNALTGVVVTVKAGRVEFSRPVDVSVCVDGRWSKIHVDPDQSLYVLTYHGEGDFLGWFQGKLYERLDGTQFYNGACDIDPSRCAGKIVEPTRSVWWVQLRNASGQVGWTNEPGKFDGKDQFGIR